MTKQEALQKAKQIVADCQYQDEFFQVKSMEEKLSELIFTENGLEYIFRFDGRELVQEEI